MSRQVGRNDPCPCGSGIKMKNCHPKGYGAPSRNRPILFIIGGIAAVGIVAVMTMTADAPPPQRNPLGSAANIVTGGGTPPPGPAPAGKVWSFEHSHWHDAPGAQTTTNLPGLPAVQTAQPLTPQPDGPAPEGKVWSAEHGHWHNDPAATPPSPTPASAQPEGTGP